MKVRELIHLLEAQNQDLDVDIYEPIVDCLQLVSGVEQTQNFDGKEVVTIITRESQ